MSPSLALHAQPKDFVAHMRSRDGSRSESQFERPVILPAFDQPDVCTHAWTDARFAIDNMAEHAMFFAQLMPQEVVPRELAQAERFQARFKIHYAHIVASGPPRPDMLKVFCDTMVQELRPFIDFAGSCWEAQVSGQLRSLVWPLYFEHARREAQRWCVRMQHLSLGTSDYDPIEVRSYWTGSMDEDARFIAHLLDPDEYALIDAYMKTSALFRHLNRGDTGSVVASLVGEPVNDTTAPVNNSETYAILSAAEAILDLKTKLCRDIESGRVKSMMDPRLAEHMRRDSIKFVDELKRAV